MKTLCSIHKNTESFRTESDCQNSRKISDTEFKDFNTLLRVDKLFMFIVNTNAEQRHSVVVLERETAKRADETKWLETFIV